MFITRKSFVFTDLNLVLQKQSATALRLPVMAPFVPRVLFELMYGFKAFMI